jgi:hypothetical protein
MSLVIDVNYTLFKRFKINNNNVFFWKETNKKFILIIPFKEYVIRTVVLKDLKNKDSINSFRFRELYSETAYNVLDFKGIEEENTSSKLEGFNSKGVFDWLSLIK